MCAVKRSAPEKLREPLLEVLRRKEIVTFIAVASLLAELQVSEAVPVLAEVMRDVAPSNLHLGECAGSNLAAFREGSDVLVKLTRNSDPTVRRCAVVGLMSTNRAKARDVLNELVDDPDPSVREVVTLAMAVLPPTLKKK